MLFSIYLILLQMCGCPAINHGRGVKTIDAIVALIKLVPVHHKHVTSQVLYRSAFEAINFLL